MKRGSDWIWPDQDGEAGKLGTTVGTVDAKGWILVAWDVGGANYYRFGANGKQDLTMVSISSIRFVLAQCAIIAAMHACVPLRGIGFSKHLKAGHS